MNLQTRYNIWKAKKSLSPDRVFKVALWKQLNSAWNQKYTAPVWFRMVWFQRAVAVAVVVLLLAGSTGAYAYSSDEVTEGTALYPVKTVLENLEEKVKVNPEAKARFYLKQLKRREKEKSIMARKGFKIEKVERFIERTEDRLEKTDQVIEKINSRDVKLREEIKARLKIRFERRKEKLGEKIERLRDRVEDLGVETQVENN
ncbi:MAG: DUF5667 domain-containing protein [Patescibacteria group bacterium]